jgi:hypothetical protein
MIVQYRKSPVVVDTIQYTGTNAQELVAWGVTVQLTVTDDIVIATLESSPAAQVRHAAHPGDFIIKGVDGEFYPCKSSVFSKTYELVTPVRP